MNDQNYEELEKYNSFLKEILRENDFLKKIKDIFSLQNSEKFQDILILQKHKYLEQVEKETLYILKKIYSEKVVTNRKFNSLYQSGKEDFESNYNINYQEIMTEWEGFNNLKNDNSSESEEKINSFYLTDFRRHCLNHEGLAIHKCGHAEKGKFIKIYVKSNGRFRNSKELKYVICEECKKVFLKDLFNNYCLYCKESYLCSILSPSENKDYFLATYASPHCESFINKTIPCKLCKEKLYIFLSDRKIKCIKCNYVMDININRNDLNWQCSKCNRFFRSKVKIYNPSESFILTKILKKALLLKIRARPQFMNCCDVDIINTPFYHKKDCKGILYLCNVENYFLKNKKWVIVCDKCHAINNCKNFIWTCPKCGKRSRETNENEELIKSPPRKVSAIHNNINTNKADDDNKIENNTKDLKGNLFQKYLSNFMIKKPSLSSCSNDDNNKKRRNLFESNNYKRGDKDKNKDLENNSSIILPEKQKVIIKVGMVNNDKQNNNNESSCKYYFRSKRYNDKRNNQININNNNSNNNYNNNNNSNNNNVNGMNRYKNSQEKYNIKSNLNIVEENLNTNNDKKKIESNIPFPRMNHIRKKNSKMHMNLKEEEKNYRYQRGDSYKSNSIIDEKEERNDDYFPSKNNYEDHKKMADNKKNLVFNLQNKRNMPVRLRYNENTNKNMNRDNKNKKGFKKSLDFDDPNNNIYQKNDEDLTERNKRLFYKNGDENNSNGEGRISKETTTHGSKGSIASSSKDNNNNINVKKLDNSNNSNNSKDKDYFYSTSNNFNFRNRRKFYIKEKEKDKSENITNLKNSIPNPNLSNKFKTCKPIIELEDIEGNNDMNDKNDDKPDDVIEPEDINYSDDIPIYEYKIKQNKELYDNLQNGIKKILEKGRLPQFNIDNYTIEKKIGDGAFGVLFSVENNKTRKKYALKKLTAHDLKQLEEFQKEFEIAYHSTHENILNLYGICIRVYDSTTFALFVLMDLAENDWEIEINKRFKEKKYYSEEELIYILKQLTSALVYLQNKKIAHRDIKPENILLFHHSETDITYKICDFGEAKENIKVNSRHKSIRGTDFYMSPILFKGLTSEEKFVRDNPYKSDVFSLGYCMIIACVLDFNFINKIRNVEEQTKIDKIIRESLEDKYSFKFIHVLLKMIVLYEKDRIDFLGLEKLINDEL